MATRRVRFCCSSPSGQRADRPRSLVASIAAHRLVAPAAARAERLRRRLHPVRAGDHAVAPTRGVRRRLGLGSGLPRRRRVCASTASACSNVYAYDAPASRSSGVQLFDQDGKPLVGRRLRAQAGQVQLRGRVPVGVDDVARRRLDQRVPDAGQAQVDTERDASTGSDDSRASRGHAAVRPGARRCRSSRRATSWPERLASPQTRCRRAAEPTGAGPRPDRDRANRRGRAARSRGLGVTRSRW